MKRIIITSVIAALSLAGMGISQAHVSHQGSTGTSHTYLVKVEGKGGMGTKHEAVIVEGKTVKGNEVKDLKLSEGQTPTVKFGSMECTVKHGHMNKNEIEVKINHKNGTCEAFVSKSGHHKSHENKNMSNENKNTSVKTQSTKY